MASTLFNLSSIPKTFTHWLDNSKKAGHFTKENVKHIVKAFKDVMEKKGSLKDFEAELHKMKQHFKTPKNTINHVVKQAEKAVGKNGKAVEHDAKQWLHAFGKNAKDPAVQKKMKAEIFKQTKLAAKNGFLVDGKETKIAKDAIKKMQKETKVIFSPSPITVAGKHKTDVEVVNSDTLNATHDLQKKGFRVVFLNMANETRPGGGAESGASAQEECIFRVSNAYLSLYPTENTTLAKKLKNGKYHIPEFGAIYTPAVTIFRKSQEEGFTFRKPYEADMISNAAYNLSKGMPKNYDSNMKAKIRAILRVAAGTGHDAVVLGAHGCGAFKNDPKVVSKLFKEVLKESEFKGQFRKVVFAVIDDQNSNGNLATFQKAFKKFAM